MSALAKTDSPSRAATVQRVTSLAGVEAWLVEDYAVPLVALDFAFTGGSSQDPAGKAGAASLLAGLLDEGAGSLDAEAFHRALDEKAIELSFGTDRDFVSGRLRTLNKNVDAAFDLLGLAVNEPRLDEAAIVRVRGQIQAVLKRETNDPDVIASKAWRVAAFPDHPYGWPPRGTLESLAKIQWADLDVLRRRLIARHGLKIAVVGAIDATRLRLFLDHVFAALPADDQLTAIPDVTVHSLGRREVVDLDVPQATIRFGLPGIPRHDGDYTAGVVVNHILGGGVFSARLFKEVREKRGLAYSVYSHLATSDHTAIFSGGTSTKNERAIESLGVIEDEIAKLAANGPSDDELDKAKKYLIGSYALRFDSSTKIASQLVHIQREGFGPSYLDERNRLIAAVTLEDAKHVAKRLFANQKLLVAIAGRPVGV